jgi:glyoxylase-like metal-dependent hydrolase (beta-lactamase superfamily II)
MAKLRLYGRVVSLYDTNCYFLENEDTREVVIVDPGGDASRLADLIDQNNATPVAFLLTHGHFDHIMAVNELKARYPSAPIVASVREKMLEDPSINSTPLGDPNYTVHPDVTVDEGDVLTYAGFRFQVLSTPGHTAGSVCYYMENESLLLAGDTLFFASYGRTDLPTGSDEEMQKSRERLYFTLPLNTAVLPGHGRTTTIGQERRIFGIDQ